MTVYEWVGYLYADQTATNEGWSGVAMVLAKFPMPERPTNLDYSRARAYCAYSRCEWGLFGYFFSHLSFLSSFSLSLGDGPMYTEILSQRAIKPKATNQPNTRMSSKQPSYTSHQCSSH